MTSDERKNLISLWQLCDESRVREFLATLTRSELIETSLFLLASVRPVHSPAKLDARHRACLFTQPTS
jgi:hypothetical protein